MNFKMGFIKLIKIIYLIPSLSNSGGMERVLTQKANSLVKSGKYSISIITTDMAETEKPFFALDPQIKVVHFGLFFNEKFELPILKKIFETRKLLKLYKSKLINYLETNQVDICISMGGKDLEFLYQIDHPCKKLYEAHFSKGIRTRTLLINKGNSIIWRLIAKLREFQIVLQTKTLDKVVVLTEKSASDWKYTNNNVIVIANPSSFEPLIQYPDLESKTVAAVGRLEYEKGFDLLIQAWCVVKYKYPEWKLCIYGDGSQKYILEKIILDNNLKCEVILKGVTQNVSAELLKSSFLVLSSRYEGMPMVMLESMACGLPMVAFDCETGPSELIESSDCGILVKNGSINDLSCKIIEMIENKEKRIQMSIRAKEKSHNYTIDKIIDQWDILFSELLNI
ncbi:glycosyl transferase [Acinetobacter variabilis]|nr:glycosyl transferase [Acinetobacter variabilis]